VIPIYRPTHSFQEGSLQERDVLVGWQARHVGQPADSVPKYLFAAGMKKSLCFYGLSQALQSTGPLLLVEGVTDVWRLAPNALSMFGTHLSFPQLHILDRFQDRPLAVVLDGDASDKAWQIVAEQRARRRELGSAAPVVMVAVPPDRDDPAACAREEVLAWVQEDFDRPVDADGP
jgi:DNA primase